MFPPFTDLRSRADARRGRQAAARLRRAGPVSAARLRRVHGRDLGRVPRGSSTARYVIIGHSERRTLHDETDERSSRRRSPPRIAHGLVPVICVGETAEDLEQHGPSAVPVAQLRAALEGVDGATGHRRRLRAGLGDRLRPGGDARAGPAGLRGAPRGASPSCSATTSPRATRILYGGSVKAANIAGFMREPNVDGALVGGASLDLDEFASIVAVPEARRHLKRGSQGTAAACGYTRLSALTPCVVPGKVHPWRFSRSSCRSSSVSRASC